MHTISSNIPTPSSRLLVMWSDLRSAAWWRDCVGMYLQPCLACMRSAIFDGILSNGGEGNGHATGPTRKYT